MQIFEVFAGIIRRLEAAEVPYMVVGSVASMVYGEPRMTHDLDLVIDVPPSAAKGLGACFPKDDFYCPPPEVLSAEAVARGQFNLIHHASGLKVDIIFRKDTKHARTEFARRWKVPFWEELDAFMAQPEDVILKKLDYFRQGGSEKHLTDIRGILAETEVSSAYLEEWIAVLGLKREWKRVSDQGA